jgi:PadR family transcriptional regulator PadR
LLTRLRADGLVSTSIRSSDSGPTRRYYEITAAGERVLSDFVVEWRAFRQSVDALLESDSPAVEGSGP